MTMVRTRTVAALRLTRRHAAGPLEALIALFLLSSTASAADCLRYDRPVALDGVVIEEESSAGENAGKPGNGREKRWVLELPNPVCIHADQPATESVALHDMESVQLAVTVEDYTSHRAPAGHPVTVRGILFAGVTAHHIRPLVMDVRTMDRQSPITLAFQEFWRKFRTAAAQGDCRAMSELAAEGFENRGILDSDPVEIVDRKTFLVRCPSWLEADAGLFDRKQGARSFLAEAPDDPPAGWRVLPEADDQARIGAFTFAYFNDQWAWTTYYRGTR